MKTINNNKLKYFTYHPETHSFSSTLTGNQLTVQHHAKGVLSGQSKLTTHEVYELFWWREKGYTMHEIGLMFRVSDMTVNNVLKGKTYSNLNLSWA